MKTTNLEIITPNGLIFSGEIKEVTLPGEEGEFGVLAEHTSILEVLRSGFIEYIKADNSKESIVIDSGYVQVDEKKVLVLVQGAVPLKGDNKSEISKAINDAKALIEKASVSDTNIALTKSKIENFSTQHS